MKILQKLSGAALLLSALLFTACSKDKDPASSVTPVTPVTKEPCRLVKAIYGGYYNKHIYDNTGKLIKIDYYYNADSVSSWGFRFTYNTAGKAAEEIRVDINNNIERKRVFTYNSQNLLTRMDIYKNDAPGGINQLAEYFLYQYNSAGKRILAQHFPGNQTGKMDFYSEYSYSPNRILAKEYNALTTPATLTDTVIISFDNMRSIYSALECWNTYYPEMEKHNIISFARGRIKAGFTTDWNYSWSDYEYNNWGYPIKEEGGSGMFLSGATYEYDCN